MPVTTVFQTSDGKLFGDRKLADAWEARLVRQTKLAALWRANKSFMNDLGQPRARVDSDDALNWLLDNSVALRAALA